MLRLIFGIVLLTVACQSKEVRVEKQIDKADERLAHLAKYKEIECDVKVSFSEPAKSAWLAQLGETHSVAASGSSTQMFLKVEESEFKWRSTPYRCYLTTLRPDTTSVDVKTVLADTEKKLETVFCIWVQSFYADSPLRGWRKGEGTLSETPNGIAQIEKGDNKAIEVENSGDKVTARLGEGGVLTGTYAKVGDKLYPKLVDYQRGESRGSVSDWVYTNLQGKEIPSSFWVNLNQGAPGLAAYMKANVSSCRWN